MYFKNYFKHTHTHKKSVSHQSQYLGLFYLAHQYMRTTSITPTPKQKTNIQTTPPPPNQFARASRLCDPIYIVKDYLTACTLPRWRQSAQTAPRICKATLTHERGSGAPVFSNDSIIQAKCCLLANLSIGLPNQGRALSTCPGLSLPLSVSSSSSHSLSTASLSANFSVR